MSVGALITMKITFEFDSEIDGQEAIEHAYKAVDYYCALVDLSDHIRILNKNGYGNEETLQHIRDKFHTILTDRNIEL